jgi:hypothetical protein
MKGELDHIIAKVWLNVDNILLAYRIVGRKPKGDTIEKICSEIEAIQRQIQTSWACKFLQDSHDAISRKRSLVNSIPSDDRERSMLLQAILAVDRLEGAEYMERVFSLRTYGNSKTFEQSVKSRILSILRKHLDADDDSTDEDILKYIGIVKYPEQFEFCGNISITFDNNTVDFTHLPSGSTIFSSDLSSGHIEIDPFVTSIITIENRANYIEYTRKVKTEAELVIYHGGQYSPRKKVFLQTIAEVLPENCRWYHWSDIDYGGFIMLSRLRKEITPDVIPYRMDSSELKRYYSYTATIKTPYIKKIKNLKIRPELSDCCECIEYMIKYMVRLEQEAMLIDF